MVVHKEWAAVESDALVVYKEWVAVKSNALEVHKEWAVGGGGSKDMDYYSHNLIAMYLLNPEMQMPYHLLIHAHY